jgi:hypothetical protein
MSEHSHVSDQHKQRVAAIICRKILVLESWAQEGIPWSRTSDAKLARDSDGCPKLIYYPKNVRSFASWDGSRYAAPDLALDARLQALETFARSTLVQPHNLDNHTRVKHLLHEIVARATHQLEELDFGGRIRALEAEIKCLNATLLRQESEIDIFRSEAESERQRRLKAEKLLDRVRRHARKKIESLGNNNVTDLHVTSTANVVRLMTKKDQTRGPQ